jgi:hypothetical protein
MDRSVRVVTVLAVLAAAVPAMPLRAQGADPRAVQPERPTVATHAHTVATGVLEIETGFEADRFGDGSRALSIPTNAKIGLGEHVQLNLFLPATGSGVSSLGAGDVGVGLKWRVLDGNRILGDFAVLPILKWPTGDTTAGRGTGTTDASLVLISSRTIGPVSLDLNAAFTVRSGDGSRASTNASLWTISLGLPVRGALGWALEYFGYPATRGLAGAPGWTALLTGPTLVLDRALAVDAGAIVPLSGPETLALYAGLVWNAGRIWRSGR